MQGGNGMNKDIVHYVDKYKDREDYWTATLEMAQELQSEINEMVQENIIQDVPTLVGTIHNTNEKYNTIIQAIHECKGRDIFIQDAFIRIQYSATKKGIGIELDKDYFEITRKRITNQGATNVRRTRD